MKLLLLLVLCFSCARAPYKEGDSPFLKPQSLDVINDDLPLDPFIAGLNDQIKYLQKISRTSFVFNEQIISKGDYIESLEKIVNFYDQNKSKTELLSYIKSNFNFHPVYGRSEPSEILLTSYYEPLLEGSSTPTPRFSRPIYRYPDDIVEMAFDSFTEDGSVSGKKNRRYVFGKLVDENLRGNKVLVPYYSREEIDNGLALKSRGLEICYLDPIDSFFLQIQGSGSIVLEDGSIVRVGYAGSNGRGYHSIGKFLYDIIPREEMSATKIEDYLRSLTEKERDEILNKNPSYVFFNVNESRPMATNNTQVVDGRTIATDNKYFPKGMLGFLYFQKPIFENASEEFELEWQGRLVLDQDTGGAIKKVDRADLFWGKGEEAKKSASVIRHEAKLFYLAPKKHFISKN